MLGAKAQAQAQAQTRRLSTVCGTTHGWTTPRKLGGTAREDGRYVVPQCMVGAFRDSKIKRRLQDGGSVKGLAAGTRAGHRREDGDKGWKGGEGYNVEREIRVCASLEPHRPCASAGSPDSGEGGLPPVWTVMRLGLRQMASERVAACAWGETTQSARYQPCGCVFLFPLG